MDDIVVMKWDRRALEDFVKLFNDARVAADDHHTYHLDYKFGDPGFVQFVLIAHRTNWTPNRASENLRRTRGAARVMQHG